MSKVRKIEPIAKLPETAIKPKIIRVAVYARVSTDMEEQASSFEAQKDYYERILVTKQDFCLPKGILGFQMGISFCNSPVNQNNVKLSHRKYIS